MSNTLMAPIAIADRTLAYLVGSLTHAIETRHEETDIFAQYMSLLAEVKDSKATTGQYVITDTWTAAMANGAMRSYIIAEYAPNGYVSKKARMLATEDHKYLSMTREEVFELFDSIKSSIDKALAEAA